MKKTLVALAVLSSVTGAMAEVNLTGLMQIGTNNLKTTTTGTATTKTTLEDSNANTSLNFMDVEDLGDGLKLTTNIGLSPVLDNSNVTGGLTTFAALSGGFGELKAGRFGNDQFWTVAAGDATGYMGNNVAVANLNFDSTTGNSTVWTSNQVRYQLPSIATGLTVAYTNKLGGQTNNTAGSDTLLVGYSAGGFNAQVAATNYKYSAAYTDTMTAVAASYDFGVAKLYALSTSTKIDSASAKTITGRNVGISVPVGAFTFMYNNSAADAHVYQRTVTAVDQTGQDLGMTYAFSKRTTGWVLFTKVDGSTGGQGASSTINSTSGFESVRFMILHSF